MEKSIIYDLLDGGLLLKWKELIKSSDECGFTKKEKEIEEELNIELNEKCKKLLRQYRLTIESKLDFDYYNLNIKILNLGIKIGIELQKAFEECTE